MGLMTKQPSVLAVILARAGSKRIPGKNMVKIAGRPLLAYTLDAAKKATWVSDIVVSSDSPEVRAFSEEQGVKAIDRPSKLANDVARSEPALYHALTWYATRYKPVDWVMLLQPTSPLRTSLHIDEACTQLFNTDATALISVQTLPHSPLKSFKLNADGYIEGLINNETPFQRSQDLPVCMIPNGAIYIVKSDLFLASQKLWTPKTLPYVMDASLGIDVDTTEDLAQAEQQILASKEVIL